MKILFLLLLGSYPHCAFANDISWGAFIDTYYAYDFNNPADRNRLYTTQPSRHNEFNINLAYIDLELKGSDRRGRLALQFGTSVDANYLAEPSNNIQIIQEAYSGVKISDNLWVDAGIFFSHIGFESFISKYNINYSRSMNADNVPYYQAGVRFDYEMKKNESLQLHLLNGWQRINENNSGKAIGGQYKIKVKEGVIFTYNNFFGDELQTTARSRFRTYHNFILENVLSKRFKLQSSLDFGTQAQEEQAGVDTWYASSIVLGQKLNEKSKLGYRIEYYLDSAESNVVTNTQEGFEVVSASFNYDFIVAQDTLWRNELRGFYSIKRIYEAGSGHLNRWNGIIVSSISMSL